MKTTIITLTMLAIVGVLFFALSDETRADSDDVREETREALEAVQEYTNTRWEEFKDDAKATWQDTKEKMNSLIEQEQKTDYKEMFAEFRNKVRELREKVANNDRVQSSLDKIEQMIDEQEQEISQAINDAELKEKARKSLEEIDKFWEETLNNMKEMFNSETK